MSKHYATRCPECGTRFQVTLEQLSKAQGLVRCGACLTVFPADKHLETAAAGSTTTAAPAERDTGSTAHIPEVPLQLPATEQKSGTLAYLGWSLLTLLAILTLGLQILWFERAQLAQRPQLQPLYHQLCQRLDCQLPPRQDLPSIVSHQLIVRDHPKYLGALSIDLLIENQAPFEQAFPALQLVFSGLNGEPRNARTFQPAEYLGGDFIDHRLMPSGKPIQLNLAIIEPDNRAPSYRLNFLPARTAIN